MAGATTNETETEQQLLARLRQVYGGKKWILAGEVAQGIEGGVLVVQALGASDAIAVCSRVGVGPLSDDVRMIISDDSHVGEDASMIERMHDNERELHNLPQWVRDEVDDWDPERQANVIATFTIGSGQISDRPTFGARKPEWAALENKITIRELWRAAGIETAPDRVVDTADLPALLAAHEKLATRWGTVWAADNEQGWHGGGNGTHWVGGQNRARELAGELVERHRKVRVQPFLEGVPCSVHGLVLAGATLAFRPCEMLVLLDPEQNKFAYCRAANFWDPSAEDREQMRLVARSIGDELRNVVDYRGVFTVDGVMTADGFRPTEVNPRFGAALPPRLPTADGGSLPVFFTHLAAVTGNLDDFDPKELEALLVARLDANRMGSFFLTTESGPAGDQQQVAIGGTWTGTEFVDVHAIGEEDDELPIATASWGNDPRGGLVYGILTDQLPVGPPVAPTIVAMRAFLNQHWDLSLTELRPAFGD